MHRGTDTTVLIKLDNFNTEDIDRALVTFRQYDTVVNKYASIVDGDEIRVDLDVEDTSKFKRGMLEIQVKILTTDGKTTTTNIMQDRVENILSEVDV